MKKAVVFLFVLLLALSCAQAEEYDVQGEWYVMYMYKNDGYHVVKNGDNYITDRMPYTITLYPDGVIDYGGEEITVAMKSLSDGTALYYTFVDGAMRGFFLDARGEDGTAYEFSDCLTMLMYDGNIIVREKDNIAEYYVKNNSLFIIEKDGYTKGAISPLCESAFVCDLALDPIVEKYSEGRERDRGKPFMLFVDTSYAQ